MSSRQRHARAAKRGAAYLEPREADIFHPASLPDDGWQQDWRSGDEEGGGGAAEEDAGEDPQPRERKRRRGARTPPLESARAAEAEEAEAAPRTREERMADLRLYLSSHRNPNTQATYESGWRQFERWSREVENRRRVPADAVNLYRPSELDVASYARYLVEERGSAMATVHTAIASIHDHLRFIIAHDYNPCGGRLLKHTLDVLKPRAKPAGQKKAVTWEQMRSIAERTEEAGEALGLRDSCMILLGYHAFLRGSEVARMNRGDISFARATVRGEELEVMRVHVHRLSKNDTERKGHERLMSRRIGEPACIVERMHHYLRTSVGEGDTPLFPLDRGEKARMSVDTPRSRLRYWLKKIGVQNTDEYGFHSVRAGGATEAANAGVPERLIKLHGNWTSDAARLYMRPGVEERLQASMALGRQ